MPKKPAMRHSSKTIAARVERLIAQQMAESARCCDPELHAFIPSGDYSASGKERCALCRLAQRGPNTIHPDPAELS